MSTIKDIVFWQGFFSIHQSALLRNLAASGGVNVTLVVWEEMAAYRKGVGWHKPDYGQTHIISGPTLEMQSELLSTAPSTTVHIFSGTRGHPMIWTTFRQCLSSEGHIGIQSEAYRRAGIKGFLRLLRGRYDALRFGEKIDFVLGIGSKGVDWFRRIGYSQDKTFPFGYFVETPVLRSGCVAQGELSSNVVELIFVGTPLYNKGLDVLLSALQGLASLEWRLHVVGSSDDKDRFIELAAKLGLGDRTHFYGTLPNLEVIDLMGKCDLLVLPSRWDGWGAVVNEALMCGVPAVCSDKCGAADLLNDRERGEVFKSGSVRELRSVLYRWISRGKNDAVSERIREWSKCIDGKTAADYLLAAIDAAIGGKSKPFPPWLQHD